jgi:GT2 family glycosyltransferase
MTRSESNHPSNSTEAVEAQLAREINERKALEKKATKLEQQLACERARFVRLSSRKSVRVALRLARFGAPFVAAFRRIRSSDPEESSAGTDQDRTMRAIRSHRTDAGPATGPLVTAVVLNRNGVHHLARLLPGLRDETIYRSFELVVVDNASTDKSLEILEQDWGFPIRVVRNVTNVTFSQGCNQGLEEAAGDYVLLLNNDISPISPGWLGALVSTMEADASLGAAGSLLVYPERPGYVSRDPNTGADLTIQHRGIRFQWRRNAEPDATVPWAYNIGVGEDPTKAQLARTRLVPAATAACLLIPAELLRKLGGLDEAFIYGMEDVDLSLRIRDAGKSIALVGAAALFHHEFGTQSKLEIERRRSHGLSNLQHFSEKWGPRLSRALNLEAIGPGPHELRDRGRPTVGLILNETTPASDELAAALSDNGYHVAIAPVPPSEATMLLYVDPEIDVRAASPDAITIGMVAGEIDRWVAQPWFGSHDVYLAMSDNLGGKLAELGVLVADKPPSDLNAGDAIAGALEAALTRPRIALRFDPRDQALAVATRNVLSALRHRGTYPTVQSPDEWHTPLSQCVDLVISVEGADAPPPVRGRKDVLWIVDDATAVTAQSALYDSVIVPSHDAADRLRALAKSPIEVWVAGDADAFAMCVGAITGSDG